MKRKVLMTILAIVSVTAVAFAVVVRSQQSNASTQASTVNWVIDNQMTTMNVGNEVWTPATDTPPTTAQNAVDQSLGLVGGADKVQSTIRVRYVLVSQTWASGLKMHPMWVVEIDKLPWLYSDTFKTSDSRTEILIDANTGKYWGQYVESISSNDPTPAQ